jgi:TetR/AcrR family transcriptional repressor of nem operon
MATCGDTGLSSPVFGTVIVMPATAVQSDGRELTARGRATRDRIVAAAAQLVHERGVAGTTLDDVRAVTGTSKSQLYHYFADKSALVRAVVELQVNQVLHAQFPDDDPLDSVPGLRRWRDRVIAVNDAVRCAGGCPLGRLASELVDADPAARSAVLAGFAQWQDRLARGLRTIQKRGELDCGADVDALAAGLLAAVQGGLLLGQATRSVRPLEAALDLAVHAVESSTRARAPREAVIWSGLSASTLGERVT